MALTKLAGGLPTHCMTTLEVGVADSIGGDRLAERARLERPDASYRWPEPSDPCLPHCGGLGDLGARLAPPTEPSR